MTRQVGATTRQMLGAPRGSVYVWVNHHLGYPRSLAAQLGRSDLEIVSPSQVTPWLFRGREIPAVVVDHAARLTGAQYEAIRLNPRS